MDSVRKEFFLTGDPVRYGTIRLAIERVLREEIPGDFAEIGVYKGKTSSYIHKLAPERKFYLFDTFEGFPERDLSAPDRRFRDTSVEDVKQALGDLRNVEFRVGWFPQTTQGLEDRCFAFVMLDADLFAPTLAALEFFYPRLVPGGYLFIHDYNSPESDHAVSKAANQFLADKPELLLELPDTAGSAVIRKGANRG